MNKLLLVLLAICLVSVHAYVKRDAPEAPANSENYLKDIQDKLSELAKSAEENIKKSVNPEEIKKRFNDLIDNATELFNANKAGAPKAA